MTNYEKYKEDIIAMGKESFGFNKIEEKICSCGPENCRNCCFFHRPESLSFDGICRREEELFEWIAQEIPPQHKYLEELNTLDYTILTEHFSFEDDSQERIEYRKKMKMETNVDPRDTWSMDIVFAIWLYEHLSAYLEQAEKVVALSNVIEFTFPNETEPKQWTQKRCIHEMLSMLKIYLTLDWSQDDESIKIIKRVCAIWQEVVPHMWW